MGAPGTYKSDFIQRKREKKINGNVTKSGNQVRSMVKLRAAQLRIKREDGECKSYNDDRTHFVCM